MAVAMTEAGAPTEHDWRRIMNFLCNGERRNLVRFHSKACNIYIYIYIVSLSPDAHDMIHRQSGEYTIMIIQRLAMHMLLFKEASRQFLSTDQCAFNEWN